MNPRSPASHPVSRRDFIQTSALAASGALAAISSGPDASAASVTTSTAAPASMPCGQIGKAKLSRMLLGGNLIQGGMHARDLRYAGALFRAYVTEEKLMETLRMAEDQGINTVFESGAEYVDRYNRQYGGHMQIIPHIEVTDRQTDQALSDHIKQQVDTGAVALYVWGLSADTLVRTGEVARLGKAVEMAKAHGLPVGVGGHSLLVPMACEKEQVPCDFYVKTLHTDKYPSATPKPLRKEYIWLDGGEGWYDNMWCLNPEETIAFMKTVTKPWIAFKILAAGAIYPREAFPYAFKNGADFIAVGMFDFQIKENCELLRKVLRVVQDRERPFYGGVPGLAS